MGCINSNEVRLIHIITLTRILDFSSIIHVAIVFQPPFANFSIFRFPSPIELNTSRAAHPPPLSSSTVAEPFMPLPPVSPQPAQFFLASLSAFRSALFLMSLCMSRLIPTATLLIGPTVFSTTHRNSACDQYGV